MERRVFLTLGGATVTATLAGCLGDGGSSPDGEEGGNGSETDSEGSDEGASSDAGGPGDKSGSGAEGGSVGDGQAPDSLVGWRDSLDWLSRNTPEPAQHAMLDGEYRVLSWWGYDELVANRGERVPAASSLQRAETAAFLLAQDESEALTALPGDDSSEIQYVMVDASMIETEAAAGGRLPELADEHPEFERGDLYLGLSDGSARVGTVHRQPYYESLLVRLYHYHGSSAERGPFITRWKGERQQTEGGDAVVQTPEGGSVGVVRFADQPGTTLEAAQSEPTRQVGGIGAVPAADVPALEQFRLVYDDRVPAVPRTGGNDTALAEIDEGEGTAIAELLTSLDRERGLLEFAENRPLADRQDPRDRLFETTPAFTKTFERVPGAHIQGSLPESAADHDRVTFAPGDRVEVSVPLDPPNGRVFTYEQAVTLDESLAFDATVPYATVGYDEYGPADGYTNVGVRANDSYTVETGRRVDIEAGEFVWFGGAVDVTEGQVVGAEDPTVAVELAERTEQVDLGFGGGDDERAGNSTDE